VHLFAHGLDQHGTCGPVVAQLTQAVEAHKHTPPGDNFALWHPRASTLGRRFQALLVAPLCGSDRRTAFEPHAPPLQTLRGRGYPSSTRRQLLGHRERLNASEVLMPTL
jgi:hypothetical protein